MTAFVDLPADILLEIVPHIPFETVLLLRALSSSLASPLAPIAFRNVRIPGLEKLLNSRDEKVVITSILKSCAFPLGVERNQIIGVAKKLTVWIPVCGERCGVDKLGEFWRFLTNFTEVEELRLKSTSPPASYVKYGLPPTPDSCLWWDYIVSSLLSTNPGPNASLKTLEMEIPMADLSLYISPIVEVGVISLRRLRLHFDRFHEALPDGYYRPVSHNIGSFAQLLTLNSALEDLELLDGFGRRFGPPRSICEFLPSPDADHDDGTRFNPKLQTLTLSGIRINPNVTSSLSQFQNLRHLRILSTYNHFPATNLWIALHTSDIHLETLETRQVSSSLLDYLSSYSGLRLLKIFELDGTPPPVEPSLCFGTIFIRDVLPQHARTLQELAINESRLKWLDYGSDWLFNDSWPLKSMTSLRVLRISPTRKQTAFLQEQYQHVIDLIEESEISVGVLEIYLPRSAWDDETMDQIFRVKSAVDGLRARANRIGELKLASGTYWAEEVKEKNLKEEVFDRLFPAKRGGWRFRLVEDA